MGTQQSKSTSLPPGKILMVDELLLL